MKVAFITEQQAQELVGKKFYQSMYFNPVQDKDNNWCISEQEIFYNDNADVWWVSNLIADKEFQPKTINIPTQ